MIPAPSNFTSLGEHLIDDHYNPSTLAKCLISYLTAPQNAESVGQDEMDDMHQRWQYREIIKDFVRVLMPHCEGIEDENDLF
ncbi:hypothetical protein FHS57_006245 [Runella defluvii]|uniref:Uncharacterized protein n=1 Tax=Runella defluvii TaxID=370973 RepID=A0A7W5ZSA5_9BACT|nr:hypothetical protein [Runella defluvii]MBB3842214.1 hypothetical protein [Runella defluvii]